MSENKYLVIYYSIYEYIIDPSSDPIFLFKYDKTISGSSQANYQKILHKDIQFSDEVY